MRRMALFAAILAVVLALSGCSAAAPTGNQVRITDSGFSPAQVTVKVGDAVTWTNSGGTAHTVTTEGVDSAAINVGKTYSRKFDEAGTYDYICRYHPTETGTVTVK